MNWIILNCFQLFSLIIILKSIVIGKCGKFSLRFYCSQKENSVQRNFH